MASQLGRAVHPWRRPGPRGEPKRGRAASRVALGDEAATAKTSEAVASIISAAAAVATAGRAARAASRAAARLRLRVSW